MERERKREREREHYCTLMVIWNLPQWMCSTKWKQFTGSLQNVHMSVVCILQNCFLVDVVYLTLFLLFSFKLCIKELVHRELASLKWIQVCVNVFVYIKYDHCCIITTFRILLQNDFCLNLFSCGKISIPIRYYTDYICKHTMWICSWIRQSLSDTLGTWVILTSVMVGCLCHSGDPTWWTVWSGTVWSGGTSCGQSHQATVSHHPAFVSQMVETRIFFYLKITHS